MTCFGVQCAMPPVLRVFCDTSGRMTCKRKGVSLPSTLRHIAQLACCCPLQTTVDVYSSVRDSVFPDATRSLRGAFQQHVGTGFRTQGPVRPPVLYLPETGQVVRTVGPSDVPEQAALQGNEDSPCQCTRVLCDLCGRFVMRAHTDAHARSLVLLGCCTLLRTRRRMRAHPV